MGEWQPIETAEIRPFDKEKWFMDHSPRLLLWNGHYAEIGSYGFTSKGKGRWRNYGGIVTPTHWMPLPPSPKEDLPSHVQKGKHDGCG